jgi:hypothetical protein
MAQRNRSGAQRQRLAYEAARIMADQGVVDFDRARRKAAERAGVSNKRFWPNNEEIQEALLAHRRLFQGKRQVTELRHLRRQALAAMRNFSRFRPRLVGPVLTGAGDTNQGVRLYLFAENAEDVVLDLLNRGIPWQEKGEILRFGGGVRRAHPILAFVAGETPFELVVLPPGALRNPPLDPVSERPEKGVDAQVLTRLLDSDDADDPLLEGER